jgi:photosystem II stability/assembly factor-like uncharacterized protein
MQVDFVNATTGWATGWGYDSVADDWGYAVLKTTDSGSNWTITRFGGGMAEITAMDFTSLTEGWLATATLANYHPATIWKTTDGGGTWAAQTTKDGATITDLAASAAGECYATGQTQGLSDWVGFVLHSADAGATWTEEFSQATVKPEAVGFASTTAVAVGAGALVLTRDAATATWTQFAPGVRTNLTNVQFKDAKLGWAVGWKSTILRTTDGGRKWNETSVPSGISLEGIDMVTKKIGWAVGCSGPHVPYRDLDAGYGAVVLRTSDGGLHWKYQVDRTTSPGLAAVDFTDTKHGVAVGTSGLTARTTDGGRTWWYKTIGSATLRDVQFTDASNGVAVGGDTGTLSSNGSIWKTNDGGVKWAKATTDKAPSAPLRAIHAQSSGGSVTSLTIVGDRSQMYSSAGVVDTWSFSDITPGVVVQDPPYYHFMDIGLCAIPETALVAADDTDGWLLGEDGEVWTHNSAGWQLPPTISSFEPTSGPAGTTVTVYGSGFMPPAPARADAVTSVKVTFGGAGYATAPIVSIAPPTSGTQAKAVATIVGDVVTAIEVTNGGSGYSAASPPLVTIGPPDSGFDQATAVASLARLRATVTFQGSTGPLVVDPTAISDTQLTVEVPVLPDEAVTGKIEVTTSRGTGISVDRFTVDGTEAVVLSHLLNHSGGSGQDNQLNGLAVVDWLNAWAVGDRGTILSFDRLPPETTCQPDNGWLNLTTPVTLAATDEKSGVAQTRWIVDPPGIDGKTIPPLSDWDSWPWQYGTTVTFPRYGDASGTRHVIYYQSSDNVGNIELDPFWLKQALAIPDVKDEVPKHMWVTVDRIGPQTYAPWPVSVARNARPAFTFWVNDDLSNKAKVTIVVKDLSDKTVKTLSLGWLATWQQFSAPISSWKCTLAKGAYTFTVLAEDQAGNTQIVPAGGSTFTVH